MKKIITKAVCLLCAGALVLGAAGCSKSADSSSAASSTAAAVYGSAEDYDYENFSYSSGLDENGYWEGVKALDYVTLPENFASLTFKRSEIEPTEEEIQSEIDSLLSDHATEKQVTDRAAADGDTVNIDYAGSVDGVAFSGGTYSGYSLTLGSGAQLARLAVEGAGSSVAVESGASVETLTARAAVKVDNQGAINKAEVQADNVVLDGKRPAHVEVADDVAPPQNSEGEEVTGSEDSQEPGQGGGGSGGGGGSVSEEAVAGIVGVRPVDQDGVEEDRPSVTAKATKKTGENFVASPCPPTAWCPSTRARVPARAPG